MKIMVVQDIERDEIEFICKVQGWNKKNFEIFSNSFFFPFNQSIVAKLQTDC